MNKLKLLRKKISQYPLSKFISLLMYLVIAKHLPKSNAFLLGNLSKQFRYYCFKRIFLYCGKNVNIEKGANLGSGFEVSIGDNSGLGVNCRVPSNIIIGKNVMMGPQCYILEANHNFDRIDIPIIEQGYFEKKQTIIEDDVWIGREVLFTPGRIVKKGSIIAARCVLSKDFPEYSIIGGNPSKVIRNRVNR